jgi:hypothetical protein
MYDRRYASFEDMPSEILLHICEQIGEVASLWSLSLTCKSINNLVEPYLYGSINLVICVFAAQPIFDVVPAPQSTLLYRSLAEKSRFSSHIRSLNIQLCENSDNADFDRATLLLTHAERRVFEAKFHTSLYWYTILDLVSHAINCGL